MKVGSKYVWLWVAIESMNKQILQVDISFERTMLIVPGAFYCIIDKQYGKHPVSTADGGTWYPPQACGFLKLKYSLHSSLKRKEPWKEQLNTSKNRTDGFDDYFPCRKKKCKLKHITNWFNLFISQHNKQIMR